MTSSITSTPFDKFRSAILFIFRILVGGYGLGIVLHMLALLTIGERWVVVEFINTFVQLIWLPTLILIPIGLIMREWRLVAMMIPGLIGFMWFWSALFIPNPTIMPQDNDIPLRVLSYNMHAGNPHVEHYTSMIRQVDADVVAIQELNYPQADILANEFSKTYPYMAFHPGGTRGQGIMSRYPISDDTYWQFDYLIFPLGHQRVEIEINEDKTIVIYNVHPTHPGMGPNGHIFDTEFRSREISDLLERTDNESLPTLLLGDFNMPDLSEDYRNIQIAFDDAFRDAGTGFGWTFPVMTTTNLAFLRLDYIFYTREFAIQDANVVRTITGSDHNALYADIFIQADRE